ncbi:hypothetical protein AS200_08525 [Streptomyces sp. CdTB01]|nr:hypothetical protein AS200_08525 [Streptomyces sp. CdTB01]
MIPGERPDDRSGPPPRPTASGSLSRRSMLGLLSLPVLAAKPLGESQERTMDHGVVYVEDHGTVQSAADAAAGKRLVFPPGRTYTVHELLIPAGCHVEGHGSILRTADHSTTSGSDDATLRVGGDAVTVDGLRFDGNSRNQGDVWSQHRHQIRVQGDHSDIRITNCAFYGIIGDGVYINIGSGGNNGHTVEIRDCAFTAANDNRNGVSVTSGTRVHVHHNTFTNMARHDMPGAIDIEPNSASDTVAAILVEDNTITRADLSGTGARYGILAAMSACVGTDIVFRNNKISGAGLGAACLVVGDRSGTLNPSSVTIVGNDIRDAGGAGVELDYGIRADIVENTFVNLSPAILNHLSFLGDASGNTYTDVTTRLA